MLSRTRVEFALHGPGYGFQAAKGRVLDPETHELAPGVTLASRVPAHFFEPIEGAAPSAAAAVVEPEVPRAAVEAPPAEDAPAADTPAAVEPAAPTSESESPKGRRTRGARQGEESQ